MLLVIINNASACVVGVFVFFFFRQIKNHISQIFLVLLKKILPFYHLIRVNSTSFLDPH
jgi:hypothetical protein